MVRIINGVVLYTPYDAEEREIGNLADAEVFEGYLSIGGHGIPLERFPKLQSAWDKLYPNGKPVEIENPQPNPNLTEQQLTDIIKFALENNAEFRKLVLPIV